MNYEQNELLEAFSDSTKNYLEKQFINYFNKISKEYKIDIDCFFAIKLYHIFLQKKNGKRI